MQLRHQQLAILHQLRSITPSIWRAWLRHQLLDKPFQTWTRQDLRRAGLSAVAAAQIQSELAQVNPDRILATLERLKVTILTLDDPAYPALLREIPSPPPWLYVRGDSGALARPSLAVVGTRRPTPYGLAVTERLVRPAAQAGIGIVSGLAVGIDAAAHAAALAINGLTVAVLGTGVDLTYPWEHRDLVFRILRAGGAVISEFPLGSPPERHHFPQRNRIISGLARATLLVEAGDHSGALITAKFALDQNREVLAVPGSILSPQSVGVNNWLRLGAKPICSAADILETYSLGVAATNPAAPPPADPDAAAVLKCVTLEPIHIDVLQEKSRLDTSLVSACLTLLEVSGYVRHLGGQYYVRI